MGNEYKMDRLISWIVRHSRDAKYNMSLSGLPEVIFHDFGINTDPGNMKRSIEDVEKDLRETLSELYEIPERNLIITTGGSESIFLMSQYAIRNGFTIHTGLPEYPPLFFVPEELGAHVVKMPWESLGGRSAGNGKRALFFSNPNNPQGNIRVEPGRADMLPWKPSQSDLVYADEAFIEFAYGPKPRSLYHIADGMIINGSMTKFYGFSNLRVGWIAGPERLISQMGVIKSITGAQNPVYPMWIAMQALQNREKFQARAHSIINENLNALNRFVNHNEHLHFIGKPTSSSYCLIGFDYETGSEKFCEELLRETGVLLSPGDYFGTERSFRLCFTQKPEEFSDSLSIFQGYLDRIG